MIQVFDILNVRYLPITEIKDLWHPVAKIERLDNYGLRPVISSFIPKLQFQIIFCNSMEI